MDSDSKVLTGLMERRALEADFRALAALTDPEQQAQQATEIAEHGSLALTVLGSLLNTEDPQLRGALGQVAALLPREVVVSALHGASRTGEQAARVTALILLERYFDEKPDDSAIAGLGDPATVALQSLRELVAAMDEDPTSIVQYLAQLSQQPPEVPHMILRAVPRAGASPHLVTLLRVLAQDEDPALAREAIDQLSHTRSGAAARALTSLAPTLPPPLAVLADRCRVKATMSGSARQGPATCAPFDAPDREWRVLLSAVSGSGSQTVMFVGSTEGSDSRILFTVVLDEAEGVVGAYGSLADPVTYVTAAAEPGAVYGFQTGSVLAWFVETTLRGGRQALREALALNWARRSSLPLEYRLFSSLIWLAEAGEQAEEAEPEAEADHGEVSGAAPATAAVLALLDHPALADWQWAIDVSLVPEVRVAVAEDRQSGGSTRRGEVITLIARTAFAPQVKERYARRLQKMSDWFALAGAPETAAAAQAAIVDLEQSSAEESLFVRRLIARGIDAVVGTAPARRTRRTLKRPPNA